MTSLSIKKATLSQKLSNYDLLVIPLSSEQFNSKKLPEAFSKIDKELSINLKDLLKRDKFTAAALESRAYRSLSPTSSCSLLILGCPQKSENRTQDSQALRKIGSIIFDTASKYSLSNIGILDYGLESLSTDYHQAIVEGVELSRYSFQRYKSEKKPASTSARKFSFIQSKNVSSGISKNIHALISGTNLARDLVNTPAEDCTPNFLAKTARDIARNSDLRCKVFSKKELERIGARALLAVGRASRNQPLMIRLSYSPKGAKGKKIALVGKGITFDTGGLSLKSSSGMVTMKCDMAGAATVLGAMQSIATIKPKIAITAYIPVAENMVAGNAIRPGDVVKAMNGKTIEILNTDAEGRLILADALHLAEKEGATTIIDLATLTGACVVALGDDYAGLFSNDSGLGQRILAAAEKSGEHIWALPLAPAYRELIDSTVADIKNTGGRVAGAITAALFLQEFVAHSKWAHIDIAGPAFQEKAKFYNQVGASGFGVRTLVNFMLDSQ